MRLIISILLFLSSIGVNAQFMATSMLGGGGAEPSSLLTDLVAYFRFEEASGTVYSEVNDYGASAGTAPTYQATGIQGYCLDFDETNEEYLTISGFWNPGYGDFTMAAWIYAESSTYYGGIAGKIGTDPDWFFRAQYNNVWKGQIDFGATYYEIATNAQPSTETWHLFLMEVDRDGDFVLYLDNVLQDDQAEISSQSAVDVTNSNAFEIGNRGDHNSEFFHDGRMDNLAIWSRVLTTEEKTALWNSGSGLAWPLDY